MLLNNVAIVVDNYVAMLLQYCHYVAGLVGIGLSQLFSTSGLEREEVGKDERLANSMGLFYIRPTSSVTMWCKEAQGCELTID